MLIRADVQRNDLFRSASSMAYISLISIVPSLMVILGIVMALQPVLGTELGFLLSFQDWLLEKLTAGSGEAIRSHIKSMVSAAALTKIGLSGFLTLLLILAFLLAQIEETLNRIWLVSKARGLFRRSTFFAMIVGVATIILAALSALLVRAGLGDTVQEATSLFSSLGLFLLGSIYLLFKYGPNCHVQTKAAFKGALVSFVLLSLASRGFSAYVKLVTFYQHVYGAVAALPLFLLWLYLSWLILLTGAVLSWRFQIGYVEVDRRSRF